MKKAYPGINIQWPISELILSGSKTVETRTYPIPEKYLNMDLVMIETPGPNGKFKARAVAIIKFTKAVKYASKDHFYRDFNRHFVKPDSSWAWDESKPKWGWELVIVKNIRPQEITSKRGIVFTKECFVS